MTLVDARGVEIQPGDVCLYGFGVGRSVAMAEAVVLGEEGHSRDEAYQYGEATAYVCACGEDWPCKFATKVSLTPSGRVRLRVVRRSYGDGEKPVVDVAPDRLVVLKVIAGHDVRYDGTDYAFVLPPSPLPTQAEEARGRFQESIASATEALRATAAPEWWIRPPGEDAEARALIEYHAFYAARLKEGRRKLKALDGDV